MKFLGVLAFVLLFNFSGFSQSDTSSNWSISIGAGYYLSGEQPIEYYSGRDNARLALLFSKNTQQYNQILADFDGYPFFLESGPSDLIYRNTGSFELTLEYQLPKNLFINLSIYNVTLDVTGIFTIRVDRANQNGNPEPFQSIGEIKGREKRSHIALSLGKRFDLKSNFYTSFNGGVGLNFIESLSNQATIEGRDYNIQRAISLTQRAEGITTVGLDFLVDARLGYQIIGGYGFFLKSSFLSSSINVNDISSAQTPIFIPGIGFTKQF